MTATMISPEEAQLRVDLAACHRLVALFGWDHLIFTHISARVPGPDGHFLIGPYGLFFEEVTASSIIKVDAACNPIDRTKYHVNPAGFVIHSAIHEAREDVGCVLHTHSVLGVAVSAQAEGLLPVTQHATGVLGSLAYHDYEGLSLFDEEKARLQRDLGDKTFMILRNHGLLTVGPTIADAFMAMYLLQRACEAQIAAQAASRLLPIDRQIWEQQAANFRKLTKGMGAELVWPALVRKLQRENPGFEI